MKAVFTLLGPVPCAEILPSRASVHSQAVQVTPESSPRVHGTLTSVNVSNRCFVYKGSWLALPFFGLLFT